VRRRDDVRARRPAGRGLKPKGKVSLARALSKFGVCSRREAERLIAAGRVRVGDVVERSPQRWIDPARDLVLFDGRRVGCARNYHHISAAESRLGFPAASGGENAFAEWIGGELIAALRAQGASNLTALEVEVEETFGQSAFCKVQLG